MQIWDFSSHFNSLAESESDLKQGATSVFNQAPLVRYKHRDEGYAIDWSPTAEGRLLSGTGMGYLVYLILFHLILQFVALENEKFIICRLVE